MTNYVLDRPKLREILLLHKSFISKKCHDLIAEGVDISKLTYRETDKFTDEFIDTMIKSLPVDSLLDQVDVVMKETVGFTSKEMMEKHEQKK
ncbi:hypothetical protein UFOVP844_29 [uncultured Caudovirales phage]|uniref:Uncharacterized protein n=1 Tax=uncultured Caudovirales phage TaxID=2100421 RepID=A0A6J5PB32_9CAUD|nr:hypothetical protein UFOVP844_29 [uncultured Caudovirales phage]